MIKIKKKVIILPLLTGYLAIFLSLLISPLAVLAAAESASFSSTSYVQLTVGGVTRTFEVTGTGVESVTVNESLGNFTLDFAAGAFTSATIVSTDKLGFAVTPATVTRILNCGASNSTLTLPHGSSEAAVTATITPSSTTCIGSTGTGGGGGSAGGGGGGGGYAYTAPTPTPTVTPTVTPVAPTVAQPPVVSGVEPSPVAQVVSPVFNSDLVRGQSNDDVRRLQELLAGDEALYPEGLVTGLFGPATERAVKRFQAKYGLPQVGRVGPMTRSKLAEVFAEGAPVAPSAPEVAAAVPPVFTSSLGRGVSNPDAKRLQQLLNSDPDTRIADSGVGSPGNETEYFGSLTEKAVQKFQKKYGVAAEGDPGYGFVGPKTRAKLQEVFEGAAPAAPSEPSPAAPETPATPELPSANEEVQKQALQQQLNDLQQQLNAMLQQLKSGTQ